MRRVERIALLGCSVLLLGAGPEPETAPVEIEELEVWGRIQKPEAIYVLPRARVELDQLPNDGRHRVLERWNDGKPRTVHTRLADGHFRETIYRPDGSVATHRSLDASGRPHGETTHFSTTGQVEATESWRAGLRHGLWAFFDDGGAAVRRIRYLDGHEVGRWERTEDGVWRRVPRSPDT